MTSTARILPANPAQPHFDRELGVPPESPYTSMVEFLGPWNPMTKYPSRRFSILFSLAPETPLPINPGPRRDPIPVPHRTIPEPRGRDLDFVNVAHSHLVHSDWDKLEPLSAGLTPFRTMHVLLRIRKDPILSLEFFDWVKLRSPGTHTLETHSVALHVLIKNQKFKSFVKRLDSRKINPQE